MPSERAQSPSSPAGVPPPPSRGIQKRKQRNRSLRYSLPNRALLSSPPPRNTNPVFSYPGHTIGPIPAAMLNLPSFASRAPAPPDWRVDVN
ncbi:hypothetical protein FOXYSP1_10504 [Fusarium oxysporum f. sp. phaseoli]